MKFKKEIKELRDTKNVMANLRMPALRISKKIIV